MVPTPRDAQDRLDLATFLTHPHSRVVLDLGCGDGRATARLAAAEPDWLVIGVDANLDSASRAIRRARRSPDRGGLPNLAFVLAPAERLPGELAGRVDELRIELPWGSLLAGLLRGDRELLAAIREVLAPGGRARVLLNARSLPDGLTPDEGTVRLQQAIESGGIVDVQVERTAIAPGSGWGKRLAGGRPLEVIVAEGRAP